MHRLSKDEKEKLVTLRRLGKSIPEIARETGTPITTVQRHIKEVIVPNKYLQLLKEKQGGAKERAKALRENSLSRAIELIQHISERDLLFLLIGLYWGEGTKKDFSVINSDPMLIQAFIRCLRVLGIEKDRLSISLRVHKEVSISHAKAFWESVTGLDSQLIKRIEIIDGKKKGKLVHGMCRIRVKTGIRDRLLLQSAIAHVGKGCAKGLLST